MFESTTRPSGPKVSDHNNNYRYNYLQFSTTLHSNIGRNKEISARKVRAEAAKVSQNELKTSANDQKSLEMHKNPGKVRAVQNLISTYAFETRPLGFQVRPDKQGNNAIVVNNVFCVSNILDQSFYECTHDRKKCFAQKFQDLPKKHWLSTYRENKLVRKESICDMSDLFCLESEKLPSPEVTNGKSPKSVEAFQKYFSIPTKYCRKFSSNEPEIKSQFYYCVKRYRFWRPVQSIPDKMEIR